MEPQLASLLLFDGLTASLRGARLGGSIAKEQSGINTLLWPYKGRCRNGMMSWCDVS